MARQDCSCLFTFLILLPGNDLSCPLSSFLLFSPSVTLSLSHSLSLSLLLFCFSIFQSFVISVDLLRESISFPFIPFFIHFFVKNVQTKKYSRETYSSFHSLLLSSLSLLFLSSLLLFPFRRMCFLSSTPSCVIVSGVACWSSVILSSRENKRTRTDSLSPSPSLSFYLSFSLSFFLSFCLSFILSISIIPSCILSLFHSIFFLIPSNVHFFSFAPFLRRLS